MTQVPDENPLDGIVTEILDPVDVYEYAVGPEGPWFYKSLRVVRVMNQIRIYDVDGELFRTYEMDDIVQGQSDELAHQTLRHLLDDAHTDSLEEL